MKKVDENRLFKRAMKQWGYQAQLGVLQEECAELIQAVSKVIRNPKSNDPYRQMAQEMADVEIMIDQIKKHTNWMCMKSAVKTNRHDKLLRLQNTLDNIESNRYEK